MRTKFAALIAVVGCPLVAHAQVGPDADRVARLGTLARTRSAHVRWDGETGTPASIRFESGSALPGTPEEAARRLIDEEASDIFERGVRTAASRAEAPAGATALVLTGTRDLGAGRVRVDFDEVVAGVPVHHAGLHVELEKTSAGLVPVRVYGRYVPDLKPRHVDTRLVEAALDERYPEVREGRVTAKPERRLVHANGRLAFEVMGEIGGEPHRVLVDAETGAEVEKEKLTEAALAQGEAYVENPRDTPRTTLPLRFLTIKQGARMETTDANGRHNLTGTVTLDHGLDGPYTRVFNAIGPELVYSGPADIRLSPAEDSAHQDEVAAFHHVGAYIDHLVRTYPNAATGAHARFAVFVLGNRSGKPIVNNAFFNRGRVTIAGEAFDGYIAMGVCRPNGDAASTARSSMVIRHEYTHAIMSRYTRLIGSRQASGINEGLSDYFPCAMEDEPRFAVWAWKPFARSLNRHYVWPRDNNGDEHRVGNMFAGALWDARQGAEARAKGGRLRVDQAVWGGLLRMPNVPSLIEGREAIVEADRAINRGANVDLIEKAFFEHGIGPRPSGAGVQNAPPVLGALRDSTVAAGSTLSFAVAATDPDGDTISLDASKLANAKLANDRFTFTPDASQVGKHQVTFTASDGIASDSRTITLTVTNSAGGGPTPNPGSGPALPPPGAAPVGSSATTIAPSRAASNPILVSGGRGGGGCELAPGGGDEALFAPLVAIFLLAALRRLSAAA